MCRGLASNSPAPSMLLGNLGGMHIQFETRRNRNAESQVLISSEFEDDIVAVAGFDILKINKKVG